MMTTCRLARVRGLLGDICYRRFVVESHADLLRVRRSKRPVSYTISDDDDDDMDDDEEETPEEKVVTHLPETPSCAQI